MRYISMTHDDPTKFVTALLLGLCGDTKLE